MNILFLSQIVPYPPHGGVLQRGFNIIREISKYNDVHLLAFFHPDTLSKPELIDESRRVLGELCSTVEYFPLWPKKSALHKYFAFTAGILYPYPFSAMAHRSFSYAKRIDELVSHLSIDVIHYDTIGLAPYRTQHPEIPSVLTHHNIESNLMARRADAEKTLFSRFYVALQAKRLRRYEISQSPLFDNNVVMSQTDEAELRQMVSQVYIRVVPNGVDIDYFQPKLGGQEPSLIYTGGMNMFANKDAVTYLLEDIWPIIKAAVPDVKFYAIGQDPPRELLELSRNDPAIKVMGYVDDIRPYVARAAVYVVPLRVGGGTRLKVLDALAQGKAIVSTSVGCEGIEVTDGKNILIEDTIDGFANKTIELLKDESRRRRLGSEARVLAEERYAWGKIGKEMQRTYEEVVKRKKS